uniref:Uncharacterized protein n=1 Tax=Strigamia maritima TaxID=126957 RepID=T1IRM4_STRMM
MIFATRKKLSVIELFTCYIAHLSHSDSRMANPRHLEVVNSWWFKYLLPVNFQW